MEVADTSACRSKCARPERCAAMTSPRPTRRPRDAVVPREASICTNALHEDMFPTTVRRSMPVVPPRRTSHPRLCVDVTRTPDKLSLTFATPVTTGESNTMIATPRKDTKRSWHGARTSAKESREPKRTPPDAARPDDVCCNPTDTTADPERHVPLPVRLARLLPIAHAPLELD